MMGVGSVEQMSKFYWRTLGGGHSIKVLYSRNPIIKSIINHGV